MIKGLDEFEAAFRHFSQTLLPAQQVLFTKKVGFELLNRVVLRTRVKHGRLRGGWQITVGKQPAPIERFDKEGDNTITAELAKLDALPPFTTVFLSNLVEYAEPREALDFMLASSVEEVAQIFP